METARATKFEVRVIRFKSDRSLKSTNQRTLSDLIILL
jgi:hypothetical protein